MAADNFDTRIDELEASYREAQERMGESSVYNDHREAAEVGRRLKDLEPAYKLIQELRSTRDDLGAARDDADLKELVPDLEARAEQLESDLRVEMIPSDP